MKFKRTKFLFSLICLFWAVNIHSQVPLATTDVMLQGFYWNSHGSTKWAQLNSQATEIAASFDMIWLAPSAAGEGGGASNMGYHPYQWSNQNSAWGTKEELKTLISNLKSKGCKSIADIIVNHRAGTGWVTFPEDNYGAGYTSYKFTAAHICKDDEANSNGHPTTGNYDYNWNVSGNYWGGYGAARDLDHSNTYVRSAIKEYLKFLKNEIGYEGWRYDLVKGYEPKYTKEYNQAAGAYFSVGEYYQGDYDPLKGWVDGTSKSSTVFDFAFKAAVYNWGGGSNYDQLAWMDIGSGKKRPAGLVHSPDMRQYAVTFIDNHDTATPHEGAWEFGGNVAQANAFMLSAPGIPCVFWKHWVSNKADIQKMIAARKSVGLHSNSDVEVTNTSGYYESKGIGTCGELICRIGNWSGTPSGYTPACNGNGWAYYTKITGTDCGGGIVNPDPDPDPTGPITLRVKPSSTYGDKMYIYSWDGGNMGSEVKYTGEWPGTAMQKDANGYFSYTFPENLTTVYAIFTDGAATNTKQTDDIQSITQSTCYEISTTTHPNMLGAEVYDAISITCPSSTDPDPDPDPSGITLKVEASSAYGDKMYIYSWDGGNMGSEVKYTGEWPGTAMQKDANGYFSYTFPENLTTVYAIFTDGAATNTQQTDDIQSITQSTCYKISDTKHPNMLGAEVYDAIMIDCPQITDINKISEEQMVYVSPNPVGDVLYIKANNEILNFSIHSISGAFIKAGTGNESVVADLTPGFYILTVNFNDNTSVITKFIKK